MKKNIIFLTIFSFAISLSLSGQTVLAFSHPGLLNNQAELDLIKAKVAAQAEPWYTGYLQVADYRSYVPQAVETYCWDSVPGSAYFLAIDGRAAYGSALRWIVTGDASYAQKAVEVMNDWSYTLKTVSVDCDTQYHSHTRLAVGGMLPPMIFAAEIIRATYSGWSQTDQDKFKQMLLNLMYPMTMFVNSQAADCTLGSNGVDAMNNNWGAMGAETRMAIAIYTDNQNYFNQAVADYKVLINKTFKPNGKYIETCRTGNDPSSITCDSTVGGDLGHTKLTLQALVAMAEMAKKQGVDLYGYADPVDGNSLLTTLVYHEPFMGYPTRTPYGNPLTWPCQVPLQDAMGVMDKESFWEMVANHYQHPALISAAQWVRPAFYSGWGNIGWETLTHNYYGQISPCGDLSCNGAETCSTCPADCGQCPSQGPIAWWKLDETSGTTASDSSGNNNNGTLVNGPIWTAGKISGALNFDGVNDYVNITNEYNFDFERTNSFSASAWVNLASVTGDDYMIISKLGLSSAYTGWSFHIDGGDGSLRVHLTVNWGTGQAIRKDSAANVTGTGWHHVAFTYNGSSLASGVNFYVDGVLSNGPVEYDNIPSGSILNDITPTLSRAGGSWLKGNLDDVRIYNRALNASEIQALYQSGSCVHRSDSNCNGCVSDPELTAFIDKWKVNNQDVTLKDLIEAIGLWKRGCT